MTTPKQLDEPVPGQGEMPPQLDPFIEGSLNALRRAAVVARQVAEQTSTDLIVVRSGQIVRVSPQRKAEP